LSLDRASFDAPGVRIAISAKRVSCVRAHFVARTTMEIRFAEVWLEDSEFSQPSIVGGGVGQFQLDDGELLMDSELAQAHWQPLIRSVKRTNLANLTLLDCDLSECRFAGAHNVDGLRFEATELDRRTWPRTRRRWLAEERDGSVPEAYLAQVYRALRKGREDSKDEPGAADFYYGEMEMRRQASSGFDRALLAGYWRVSGYGLRAWRALAALGATILLFACAFQAWGFDPSQDLDKSLLFSAESTTSLFRGPSEPNGATLTDAGRVLQIGLRLLGPLFFGLALLALRGRVKR
jgi:hypothetical protein